MVKGFINKVYGNIVVLKNLRGQRRVPYLPQEKLHALRDARLKKIVKYAANTVPYYRNLFQRGKIDPREIKTVDDLDCFPLIDKEMVRKNPDLFVSTSRKSRNSIPFITSGSTGEPLTVYHDQCSLLANIAFGEREREVIKNCRRAYGYKEIYIIYPESTFKNVMDFYRQNTFIPMRPERLMLSVLEPMEHIIEVINRFCPDIIISYGSYLETLFRTLDLQGIRMNLPRMLIYSADSMTEEGRDFIEEKFNIPIYSGYDAVEAFKIGFFCEKRRGFHIHEDLCYVKIINEVGEKVANGEKGEVVISNLVNRGTVLLNYRLGDIASISNMRCSCGRTQPLLSELEGRIEDIIFLRSGECIHPRAVWSIFKGRNEVLQYQLIQHESERFELKLVTRDREIYQGVINGILSDLRHLLGESAIIESGYYQELDRQKGGKFRPVISLCKPKGFR